MTATRGEEDGGSSNDTDDVESLEGVAAVSLLSDADASRDEVVIYDEGDGGKLATTKAAVTIKAEQQSVTKSGKWHRPNKFGQLFFKIMNPRES